jgi:hypothetical protein
MWKHFTSLKKVISAFLVEPHSTPRIVRNVPATARGFAFARDWQIKARNGEISPGATAPKRTTNPLWDYFKSHQSGRGIWKWEHYFDAYERHFRKYVGREVVGVEVGIYSGGSLNMWRSYFGPRCKVYGVDIEEACKTYEEDGVRVFIGDQADRSFWQTFKKQVPQVDILIDDGGHTPEQQIVTLEEMLPHLRPGGVYFCEDVHGTHNEFASYVSGLASHFHEWAVKPGQVLAAAPTEFQRAVSSIHLYPFLVVIERTEAPINSFVAPKRGTEWQPFIKAFPHSDQGVPEEGKPDRA